MANPELLAEQAHVDHAYDRLEAMRAAASDMLQEAFGERGGTFQSFTERDIRVRTSLSRLEQLQIGDESLVFGRIDRTDDETFHIGRLAISDADQEPLVVDWRAPVVEPFYRATGAHPMGLSRRRHFLTDGRRLLDLEDELFDEDGAADGVGLGLGLSGSQVLLAALSRARTGRMRDIVATVQREQDEIIRSPLAGIQVVQGGPGTGKTAVALHRAAYLLYTHRFPLEPQGVLVVGPNPTFLRYIGHVLPSLGESGVELTTIAGLYSHARASTVEDRPTARLKGDARMARVIARAVADRQRPLRRTVEIPYGRAVLRLSPQASAQIVAAAKRRPGTHNSRRRAVESLLWRVLLDEVNRRIPAPASSLPGAPAAALHDAAAPSAGPPAPSGDRAERACGSTGGPAPSGLSAAADASGGTGASGGVGASDGSGSLAADLSDPPGAPAGRLTAADLGNELRHQPDVAEALDRMWPVLTAEELLHDLFGAAPLVDLAARSTLDGPERASLLRSRSPTWAGVSWTDADIPLLDEARALLGAPRRKVNPEDPADIRSFGHIVVDEAQDLSPMQLRMLARRSLGGSMTVVGDIAQATGSWAPAAWSEVVAHLPAARGWRQVELTVNYRTPSEIMALAGRVLSAAAPGMVAPEAVRDSGEAVRFVSAPGGIEEDPHPPLGSAPLGSAPLGSAPLGSAPLGSGAGSGASGPGAFRGTGSGVAAHGALTGAVATTTREELEALSDDPGGDGRLAIIAPPSLLDELASGLREVGIDAGTGRGAALDARATLLAVEEAKGLEFDTVLVVDPAGIEIEAAQGLRSVYVALTRATRRLAVVYDGELPEAMRPDPTGAGGSRQPVYSDRPGG